ncbi:hypothetical protein PPTG_10036 [Phytophthora nicotianae INRA-310]|uniref:Ubiquitin-like protease family profile domain-containing protein n=1 Tax=Phytophthora nicotianae (strain INRA-310) TaxID=761204 RepID=W2QES3_PHYN3|nr:hypothetical protein PPTG_10036 [Phytophthora nicotianae INRA-310]ETN11024.1 hypothetical protein PPTG_10036 [Phytophthora nicotianae INRA-310]
MKNLVTTLTVKRFWNKYWSSLTKKTKRASRTIHLILTTKMMVGLLAAHVQYGTEFLDFRETLWLHSGSIIGGLLALRESYKTVSIVNPRFHDFDHPDQKMRTAKGYRAAVPGIKKQLKSAVGAIVEPMLGIEDRLSYEVVTGRFQKDNSSCGVWCLVVLELLLFGATPQSWSDFWNNFLYDVLDYLSMRYLYKVGALERQISIMAEGDE